MNSEQLNDENKVMKESKRNWILTLSFLVGLELIMLIIIIAGKIQPDKYMQVLIGLSLIGLFIGAICLNLIKKTVGLNFAIKLFKLNKLKKKGYGLLKEFTLAGRPQYHIVKFSEIIKFKTKQNGEDKQGLILYNPYAKYEDFGGNIPIIEGTINDISPKNFLTGNRIGINPDLIDKIVVESGISQKDLEEVKKHRRWLMYLMIGVAVAGILSFDLFAQRLSEANAETIACYKEVGKSVTVNALLPLIATIKEKWIL